MTDASRPQPVVDLVQEAAELATRVSAFVKGLGAVLVLVGITSDSEITRWAEVAGLVIVTVGELGAYVYTRIRVLQAARAAAAQVTPLTDPQDDRGVELVPVDQVAEPAGEPVDPPGKHAAQELAQ